MVGRQAPKVSGVAPSGSASRESARTAEPADANKSYGDVRGLRLSAVSFPCVLYSVPVVQGRDDGGSADARRQRARERVLRQAIADLTAEVRDLQAQLSVLAEARERALGDAGGLTGTAAPVVAPPSVSGAVASLRRWAKLALRGTLGTARRLWRAADPAQRYVVASRLLAEPLRSLPKLTVVVDAAVRSRREQVLRTLARQTAAPREIAFWDRGSGSVELVAADGTEIRRAVAGTEEELRASVEGDFLMELPARLRGEPSTLLECLQWLLASERLGYARVLDSPAEDGDDGRGELLVCETSLWRPGGIDLDRLAAAAAVRPVVGKTVGLAGRLDAAVPRLAPLGRDSREVVCRTGRYDVWAGNRAGPVEHAVRPVPPLAPATDSGPETVLVMVASALAGGSAEVVAAAVRSLRGRLRFVVVSTAADHSLGVSRVLAFERLGATVYELGTVLQPEAWRSAVARVAHRYRPTAVLVVGVDPRLDPALADLRAGGVRIVALAGGGASLGEADARLLAEAGGSGQSSGGDGGRVEVPAGWLMPAAGSDTPPGRRAAIRAELGIPPDGWLVVTAVDLVPAGRPEDVVVVADRLRDEEDVRFLLVGDGPLAGTVVDLVGFLGVCSVRLQRPAHPLTELVAAADLVLDPSEEPVARPLVIAALAAGVPVVSAPGGGAERLVGEVGGGIVVPSIGDPDGLADAVLAVRSGGLRPDPRTAREVLARRSISGADAVRAALLGPASAPATTAD
jgi:glycosyltransferase involved in cell wall biosynthesis